MDTKIYDPRTESIYISGDGANIEVYSANGDMIEGITSLTFDPVTAENQGFVTAHLTIVGVRLGKPNSENEVSKKIGYDSGAYWKEQYDKKQEELNKVLNSQADISRKSFDLGYKSALQPIVSDYDTKYEQATTTSEDSGGTEVYGQDEEPVAACTESDCCHSAPCTKIELTTPVLQSITDKVRIALEKELAKRGIIEEY